MTEIRFLVRWIGASWVKKLRLARERRGLTQEQAAKTIGVARTTLVAIEKDIARFACGIGSVSD